jgi:hypothetical protein
MKSGDILESGNTWKPWNRLHQLVCPHIHDIQNAWTKVGGEEIVIFAIDREIVEALTFRARHFDNCDPFW